MPNDVHIHLMLAHIPIIFVPLGLLTCIIGIWKNNKTLKYASVSLFLASALLVLPIEETGESAEEKVEHVVGISEKYIENHEEAAETAVWITIALGIIAIGAVLTWSYWPSFSKPLNILLIITAIAASASLAHTGQEGGKIRHPEAFSDISKQKSN